MQCRRPYHWVCVDDDDNNLIPVSLGCDEGAAILNYFLQSMPEKTELLSIERNENMLLFMPYFAYKESVLSELPDWSIEQVESWLFHGTSAVEDVLRTGFKSSCVNLKKNRFGSGSYFARDPRLAHWFLPERRASGEKHHKLILTRVVVGRCAKKVALSQEDDLTQRRHREAPTGFHSCTSEEAPGREIIVFPGSPGCPAYPAYVLTYKTFWQGNPYKDTARLLRMNIGMDRTDSHVFNRYRTHPYRLHWKCCQLQESQDNPQEPPRFKRRRGNQTDPDSSAQHTGDTDPFGFFDTMGVGWCQSGDGSRMLFVDGEKVSPHVLMLPHRVAPWARNFSGRQLTSSTDGGWPKEVVQAGYYKIMLPNDAGGELVQGKSAAARGPNMETRSQASALAAVLTVAFWEPLRISKEFLRSIDPELEILSEASLAAHDAVVEETLQ